MKKKGKKSKYCNKPTDSGLGAKTLVYYKTMDESD